MGLTYADINKAHQLMLIELNGSNPKLIKYTDNKTKQLNKQTTDAIEGYRRIFRKDDISDSEDSDDDDTDYNIYKNRNQV